MVVTAVRSHGMSPLLLTIVIIQMVNFNFDNRCKQIMLLLIIECVQRNNQCKRITSNLIR